jgi:Bacterial Ig-like domain
MLTHARCRPGLALTALLAGCAGNGDGLDANGDPLSAGNTAPPAELTADFQSIQDKVFTPICVPCHSGASAPEGLQLDAAHSYALLVGVPSAEVPSLLRVAPGSPDLSYLVLKLQGAPNIVGAQMPFGGPYLSQSTIDVIRQWIRNGAPPPPVAAAGAHFAVEMVSPADHALLASPSAPIVVVFNHDVDASLINYTTLRLDRLTNTGAVPAGDSLSLTVAAGNARAVLVRPDGVLAPGDYRLTLRGSGGGALADLDAVTLEHDYEFHFTVAEGQ